MLIICSNCCQATLKHVSAANTAGRDYRDDAIKVNDLPEQAAETVIDRFSERQPAQRADIARTLITLSLSFSQSILYDMHVVAYDCHCQ